MSLILNRTYNVSQGKSQDSVIEYKEIGRGIRKDELCILESTGARVSEREHVISS